MKLKEYRKLEAQVEAQIASIDWREMGAMDRRFSLFGDLNKAFDTLSRAEQAELTGAKTYVSGKTTMNSAATLRRSYKKEIDKGVYVRDLIQPLDEKGKPNPDFVEHYGIANYTPEQKEHIRDTMGRDKTREKDWRTEKK